LISKFDYRPGKVVEAEGESLSAMRLADRRWKKSSPSAKVNDGSLSTDDEFSDRGGSGPELKYFVSLDSKGDLNLYWDFDDVTETVFFRVEAKIEKSDLFAFGFSDYGEPENADLCVMWTGLDEKHRFQVWSS
jgi:hypothetical protein